jgi:hypothetical protein
MRHNIKMCFFSFTAIFFFINPDYRSIRMTSPSSIQITEDLLYIYIHICKPKTSLRVVMEASIYEQEKNIDDWYCWIVKAAIGSSW